MHRCSHRYCPLAHLQTVPAVVCTLVVWGEKAKKVGMGPLATTAIFPVSTLLLSAFTCLAQRLSLRLGRVATAMLGRALGISCLLAMALLEAEWHRVFLMVGLYVVRTALMNAQYPLLKSILMDYVSKRSRGKVNSLESISQFGWSGSAILGGVLLDKYDYQAVFFVTAAMQLCSWCLMFLLCGAVVDEERGGSLGERTKKEAVKMRNGGGKQPLLGGDDEQIEEY